MAGMENVGDMHRWCDADAEGVRRWRCGEECALDRWYQLSKIPRRPVYEVRGADLNFQDGIRKVLIEVAYCKEEAINLDNTQSLDRLRCVVERITYDSTIQHNVNTVNMRGFLANKGAKTLVSSNPLLYNTGILGDGKYTICASKGTSFEKGSRQTPEANLIRPEVIAHKAECMSRCQKATVFPPQSKRGDRQGHGVYSGNQ